MPISYGSNLPDDHDLRLCGDVSGKRVVELGVANPSNAVTMAVAGGKALAIDPDLGRLSAVRAEAERAEVNVPCLHSNLADLGEVTSATVDLVLAVHSLKRVDDLSRLFRQVHRILKPGAAFVVAISHPVAEMFDRDGNLQARYGDNSTTLSDLYMTFERTNFHIDQLHEIAGQRASHTPTLLVLRARKQGI